MQKTLNIQTRGRGTYNITAELAQCVQESGIDCGLCHCFVRHTVELVSPKAMNESDRWKMEPLKEIWHAKEPTCQKQSAYVFVLR